ncbi:MAG: hypothetical protein NT007_08325 [Candidatus Kapabacteria bacterium]|nr:hypothetical protein [Candidatus Kapabacteria bacterium]
MFRNRTIEDSYTTDPQVTVGSIVMGALLRIVLVLIISFILASYWWFREYWWMSFFILWFFAVYPAYRQYQGFNTSMDDIKESTLCGSCKHFDSTSQFCMKYNEHMSKDYIPCEGMDWEPFS